MDKVMKSFRLFFGTLLAGFSLWGMYQWNKRVMLSDIEEDLFLLHFHAEFFHNVAPYLTFTVTFAYGLYNLGKLFQE